MTERDDLEKMLKRLKKDFQRNVQPVLKKHSYFVSKGERARLKKAKAIRRMRRRERQFSRAAWSSSLFPLPSPSAFPILYLLTIPIYHFTFKT